MHWQQSLLEQRRHDIAQWAMPLLPLRNAMAIVLKFARESSQATKVIANQGRYQQMLSARTCQLMQIRVPGLLRGNP
jgi:cell division protein ZapD